jgi:serine/threonine protein kinase
MSDTPQNTRRDGAAGPSGTGFSQSGDLSGISEMFGLRDGQQAESGTRTGTDTVGRWVAATEGDALVPADASGRLVHGRYRLIAELGVGGMGVSYRAWDTTAGIPVVVKMPRRELRTDSEAMQRFAREIDAMLAVPQDNIVPITDHGDDDGCPFVVIRFLPGGSLADYRRRDEAGNAIRNPPGMLHFWLPGVAAALDHIHAKGMLHRDVKPGNIFLDGFLKPYLGDFGIAKVVDESGGLQKEQTLTATKMAVGTPEYMAPELFKPRSKPNGSVDQYALAVTVYEMLSGDKPFKGDRAHIIVEHSGLPVPPLAAKVPGLPQRLCMAVEKGLAKSAADRFQTCRDFAAAVLADLAVLPPESDTVRLLCPSCKNILKLPQKAAGQTGRCPRCREAIDVAADLGSLWLEREERGVGMALATTLQSLAPLKKLVDKKTLRWDMIRKWFAASSRSAERAPIPLSIRISVITAMILTGLFGVFVDWQYRTNAWMLQICDKVGVSDPPLTETCRTYQPYTLILTPCFLAAGLLLVAYFRRRAWPTVLGIQMMLILLLYEAMLLAGLGLAPCKAAINLWADNAIRWMAVPQETQPLVISNKFVDSLGAYKGPLVLHSPLILTDYAATKLSEYQGDRLELDGLSSITPFQAAELAKYKGLLSLCGLTTLSDDAAGLCNVSSVNHRYGPDRSERSELRAGPYRLPG